MEDYNYYQLIEIEQETKVMLAKCIQKIKDKVYAKYKDTVRGCSGMNNSAENEYIRKVSHEMASLLAEIDKEVERFWLFDIDDTCNDSESIRYCKNKVVDIMMPTDKDRCTRDYQRKLREAGVLADALEHYFMLGYRLGCGRREMTKDEEKKIDEKWERKCNDDLNNAYSAGSQALALMLRCALANPEVMNELRERRIL